MRDARPSDATVNSTNVVVHSRDRTFVMRRQHAEMGCNSGGDGVGPTNGPRTTCAPDRRGTTRVYRHANDRKRTIHGAKVLLDRIRTVLYRVFSSEFDERSFLLPWQQEIATPSPTEFYSRVTSFPVHLAVLTPDSRSERRTVRMVCGIDGPELFVHLSLTQRHRPPSLTSGRLAHGSLRSPVASEVLPIVAPR